MKNQHNKKKFAMIAMVMAGVLALAGCGADKIAENEKYMKDDTEVVETVEEVKLTDYVVGLHDWTVEVNSENIDFMKDVEYNKEVVKEVKVDSTKVDLGKEGKYDLVYTIVPVDKNISDVDVTKKVTVKVVSVEEAQKEANKGNQVAVSGNEVKKDSNGKTPEAPKKEEPRKDVPVQKPVTDNKKPAGNTGSNSNSNKPAEQPSQKPDNNKPADKPVEKPAAPSKPAEPAKPVECSHNWTTVSTSGGDCSHKSKVTQKCSKCGATRTADGDYGSHNYKHVAEKSHQEQVPKFKWTYWYECNGCHKHFDDEMDMIRHDATECGHGYSLRKEQVSDGYDTVTKVDDPAHDECTICGARK